MAARKLGMGQDALDQAFRRMVFNVLAHNWYENGDWQSVKSLKKEIKKAKEIAGNTFKKDKRINIRISERDLAKIQKRALKEGMPYQTLISSLIHKFVDGLILEKKA